MNYLHHYKSHPRWHCGTALLGVVRESAAEESINVGARDDRNCAIQNRRQLADGKLARYVGGQQNGKSTQTNGRQRRRPP